jgi:hypothetical protein
LQIQDDVIVSDAERLRITQSNVKMVLSLPPSPLSSYSFGIYILNNLCSFKDIFKLTPFLGLKEWDRKSKFFKGVFWGWGQFLLYDWETVVTV